MPVDQALRLTSILLAAASFVGLILGTKMPEWLTVLTGAALITVLLRSVGASSVERLASQVPFPSTGWNLIVIGGFLGFWIDMLWVSGELLPAGLHFLMILLVVKLFTLQLRRDYLHLYAISLVAILASGSLTTEVWYLPVFSLYLLTGVWTLLLFQLTKSHTRNQDLVMPNQIRQDSQESLSRVTPQLFWLANGLALGTFAITLVIFFTIPRVNGEFYQKGFGENIRTSGFSDTVNLGAIGPIKRDPSVVMRIELMGGSPHDAKGFYVRGVAFDQYDGKSWTNSLSYRRSLSEEAEGTFIARGNRSLTVRPLGDTIEQKIILEPLDTPVLFAAPFIERVSGAFTTVQSDLTGSIYLPFPSASRIEYSVVSRSAPLVPADLAAEPRQYSESFGRHFLQYPYQSERLTALAREITQDKRSVYEKATAIQAYLSHNYRYSLDAPLAELDQPLEEFLFTRKTGYCEHYATAMVIMLRTVGIPARLVTGFLTTEWNKYGNYYVVRQQDAHAWVEMHLPHSGWIMMDPTPSVFENAGDEDTAWQTVGRLMDRVKLQWSRLFVQYSAADQLAVARELKAGGATVRNKAVDSVGVLMASLMAIPGAIIGYATEETSPSLLKLLGLMIVGLGLLLWLGVRQPWISWKVGRKAFRNDQGIVLLYGQMMSYLSRQGISKSTTTAPLEFVGIVQLEGREAHSAVASITALYCRARFGRIPLTEEELQGAEEYLRRLMAPSKP